MVNLLSGLCGKSPRPIIINGQTLKKNGKLVVIQRDNYKVTLSIAASASAVASEPTDNTINDSEELLKSEAKRFHDAYGAVGISEEEFYNFQAMTDTFTSAIVMRSSAYDKLLDINNTMHLYDGTRQFTPEVGSRLKTFVVSSMINYFEIFLMLLNRRLTGSRMPVKIKSHLVAGLWQPYIVKTKFIESPLDLECFSWVRNYLNEDEVVEEILESVHDTVRGLQLSVISSYNFSERLHTPIIRELDRRQFMFMLLMVLARTIDENAPALFSKTYPGVFKAISNKTTAEFLLQFNNTVKTLRNGLAIR